MTTHTVTLEQFADLVVGKLAKEAEGAIVKGLRSAGLRLQGFVKQEVDEAQPFRAVDRGELRQSIAYSRLPDGSQVRADAPHAPMIEYGTRPFTPPLQPLIEWVERKGFADSPEAARRIARAIQQKIAREGIAPRHYMAKAYARIPPVVLEEVEAELREL